MGGKGEGSGGGERGRELGMRHPLSTPSIEDITFLRLIPNIEHLIISSSVLKTSEFSRVQWFRSRSGMTFCRA